MSTTFRSVSYGACSRTGVTCVAADFGGIIKLQSVSCRLTVNLCSFQ